MSTPARALTSTSAINSWPWLIRARSGSRLTSRKPSSPLSAPGEVSVAGLFFIVLVFWISPALSNYGIMNLFLFAQLFAFGYWAAALGGQNIHAGAVMF